MRGEKGSKGIRVLTIATHAIVRAGLESTLANSKVTILVGEASGVEEAVSKARQLEPDVILFALDAAKQEEILLIQTFRSSVPEARILILGSEETPAYVLGLLRAGAHGYSSRTSPTSELIRATKAVHRGEIFLHPSISRSVLELGETGALEAPENSRQKLSPRESQVLGLIAKGLTNRQIGERLRISARTVETHRERIMRKLKIHTVAGLTRFAIEHDVTDEPDLG